VVVTILALLAGTASRSGAQVPDTVRSDTAYALPQMVVRSPRLSVTSGGVSALEMHVDSMRLPPAPTLEDLARSLPLLRVRTNSRGEAQPTLRGSESRQVVVLVDGIPLTLGWDHRSDLGLVPVGAARTVTLLRGLPSVLHGPNVLGGVVEVGVVAGVTRPDAPPPVQATLGLDHAGGRQLTATGSHLLQSGPGAVLLRAGAGYRARAGFERPSGVGSVSDAALRDNSDLEQVTGFVAGRFDGDDGAWLSASASGYDAERGVPPELHVQQPRLWRYPHDSRILAAVSGGTGQRTTRLGAGDLEASIGVDTKRTVIESYRTAAYREVEGREEADDRVLTLRLLGDHTLGPRADLRLAATLADVLHDEAIDGAGVDRYRQRLWSLGAEVAWRPVEEGALRGSHLTAGLAYDGANTSESGPQPPFAALESWGGRLGVNHILGRGGAMVHAGVSRRARFPSLRELYSGALGRFEPNPALRPEVLAAWEAGVTTRVGGVEVQAVAFHQQLSNVIVRTGLGDGRFRRDNRDRMQSMGIEVLTGGGLGPARWTVDLTLQDVTVLDPSASAEESRPEYQPALAGRTDWRLPLPRLLDVGASAQYVGRQWCVSPEQGDPVTLPPRARFDMEVGRSWGRVSARIALENVADAAVYDQCGLPQPGRTLRFRLGFN
jgi:iron complex outermembrane recepter protein